MSGRPRKPRDKCESTFVVKSQLQVASETGYDGNGRDRMSEAVETQDLQGAPAGHDPSLYAVKMAAQLKERFDIEEETRVKQRKRITATRASRREDGTIVLPDGREIKPRALFPEAMKEDFTSMRRSDGSNPIKPGWCARWVRIVDPEGKPSQFRIHDYRQYGYEVILDCDGTPLKKGDHLVAMQGSPEALAARILDKQDPGVSNQQHAIDHAYEVVEDLNRQAGREVLSIYTEPGHRIERREAPFDAK